MNVIKLNYNDKNELANSYVKYFCNGGIFIRSNHEYDFGQELFLLISILNEDILLAVSGTVCWYSPKDIELGAYYQVGVQFNNDKVGNFARETIENLLTKI